MKVYACVLIMFSACAMLVEPTFACETTRVTVTGNLDSRQAATPQIPTIFDPIPDQIAAAEFTQYITLYDSLGNSHATVATFYKQANAPWIARYIVIDPERDLFPGVASAIDVLIVVDENGVRFPNRREDIDFLSSFRWNNGAESRSINFRFGVTSKPIVSTVGFEQDGSPTSCQQRGSLDFDGDGRDDFAIWRPEFGLWAILKSSVEGAEFIFKQWGLPDDYPMPGDYTGDGKADLVLYRRTTAYWYVCKSDLNYNCSQPDIVQFGLPGDIPVKGDYDGDGILDYAVYRLSSGTFFYRSSRSQGLEQRQWGLSKDIPLQAGINQRPL